MQTAEYLSALKTHRENLSAQQQKALAAYHQASGAIAIIDVLLRESAPADAKNVEEVTDA